MPDINFRGMQRPSTDFQSVRAHLQTTPGYFDVDLSTARSLAAGTALIVNAAGNFLYADQLPQSGYASIHFEDINPASTPVTIFPGACFRVPFTTLAFENIAQPGLKLRILIGTDVAFEPSNVAGVSILNAVSVVDGGKARTIAGQAFMGSAQQAAVGAQFSYLQLLNPAGSGIRTVVKRIRNVFSDIAMNVVATLETGLTLPTLAGNWPPKKSGGTFGVSQLRATANAGVLYAGAFIDNLPLAVTSPAVLSFEEPVVLYPGYSLTLSAQTVNGRLGAGFEGTEEPNT